MVDQSSRNSVLAVGPAAFLGCELLCGKAQPHGTHSQELLHSGCFDHAPADGQVRDPGHAGAALIPGGSGHCSQAVELCRDHRSLPGAPSSPPEPPSHRVAGLHRCFCTRHLPVGGASHSEPGELVQGLSKRARHGRDGRRSDPCRWSGVTDHAEGLGGAWPPLLVVVLFLVLGGDGLQPYSIGMGDSWYSPCTRVHSGTCSPQVSWIGRFDSVHLLWSWNDCVLLCRAGRPRGVVCTPANDARFSVCSWHPACQQLPGYRG
mmetsp:Transcript_48019/g.112201  ORF Transcript_48019/g.112201 Transcript_48019/m.112201 type:complete len:262 (+) Transcript_48019:426-1211(+)